MSNKRFLVRNKILPVLIVLGLIVYQYYVPDNPSTGYDATVDGNVVQQAYASRQSGKWLEARGHIKRVLRDDNEGARHQKFILEMDDGHTVMVAHNVDLARRIPAREDLLLCVRGRFVWNVRGGVIHWTHHDPDGRLQGGWIEVDDVRYE
jgi:hypothetical protein